MNYNKTVMIKSTILVAFIVIFSANSFTQCWKTVDIKGDTNGVILAIRDDKTLWDFTNDPNGVQVGTQAIFEKCFSSNSSHFAIAQDSTLWGWGGNYYGELGIGNTNPHPNISQVNYSKWLDISLSYGATTAVKSDGTIWFWGHLWPNPDILIPTQIGTDNDWLEVQSSYNLAIAMKNNHTLWKKVNQGQFTQLNPDTDWNFFWSNDSGTDSWWGIKNNGTLWFNGFQVGLDNNWKSIKNYWGSSYGIKTDGTLWFWYGSVDPLLVPPVQVTTLSNFIELTQHFDWNGTSGALVKSYAIHDNNQLWIEKYNINVLCPATTIGSEQFTNKLELSLVPNPTIDQFTIQGLEKLDKIEYIVLKNIHGEIVKKLDVMSTFFTLENMPIGVYLLEIKTEKIYEVIKLVKE